MPETSSRLSLPYIQPSQAQSTSRITRRSACSTVPAQWSVISRTVISPPASPPATARYIVPGGASGAWAGQSGRVAAWQEGGWTFQAPRAGWIAWVEDQATLVGMTAGAGPISPLDGSLAGAVDAVGINAAAANATNRLTVSADATLLTHDGAGIRSRSTKRRRWIRRASSSRPGFPAGPRWAVGSQLVDQGVAEWQFLGFCADRRPHDRHRQRGGCDAECRRHDRRAADEDRRFRPWRAGRHGECRRNHPALAVPAGQRGHAAGGGELADHQPDAGDGGRGPPPSTATRRPACGSSTSISAPRPSSRTPRR